MLPSRLLPISSNLASPSCAVCAAPVCPSLRCPPASVLCPHCALHQRVVLTLGAAHDCAVEADKSSLAGILGSIPMMLGEYGRRGSVCYDAHRRTCVAWERDCECEAGDDGGFAKAWARRR